MELYFHIPFCVRKCFYCDFLSAPADGQTKAAYMEALRRETALRAEEYRCDSVTSVFIGGGTPSAVKAEEIAALLSTVRQYYPLAEDAEITIEVNPGTVTAEKLEVYRVAGINRLSIGLQSADDRELAAIGRIHTWQQFLDTYGLAVGAGYRNINIDVMSTLPGQTLESYRRTLEKILALTPPAGAYFGLQSDSGGGNGILGHDTAGRAYPAGRGCGQADVQRDKAHSRGGGVFKI